MTRPRLAPLPIEHVVAELAAFPLASRAALELQTVELPATGSMPLWRAAEKATAGAFPAFSVDEAVNIRDRLWFHDGPTSMPLHCYLRHLARDYLERKGPVACPRLSRPSRKLNPGAEDNSAREALARHRWRWLTFALPGDLLLAALAAPGNPDDLPRRVTALTPNLRRKLEDKGFAETHLHMGAGLSFDLYWVSTLQALRTVGRPAFQSPGAEFNAGADFGPWLLRAAIGRWCLAVFLASTPTSGLLDYLARSLPAQLTGLSQSEQWAIGAALNDLAAGTLSAGGRSFPLLQNAYARLFPAWQGPLFLSDVNTVPWADPIAGPFGFRVTDRTFPEMRFVSRGLSYLTQNSDPLFATLFWQVVRIRCLFYRHVVQRPMIPGLQWFIRFYGRIRPGRTPFPRSTLLQSAACSSGIELGLRSLEIRTSPDDNISNNLRLVTDVARAPLVNRCEVGLVHHFTKSRSESAASGRPIPHWKDSHADPGWSRNAGYRYGHFYRQEKAPQAVSLANLLLRFPLSREVVRGIDVCTDELGVPTWVLVPIFRHVRRAAQRASQILRDLKNHDVGSFRTTAHVGEDFVHLLGGLRRVDEALEYFELRAGDRLGHAVALGIHPEDWASQAGRVPMAVGDRLLDLIWEWSWWAASEVSPPMWRLTYLGREIPRLSQEIFGRPLSKIDLETLVRSLHNPYVLQDAGFPNGLLSSVSAPPALERVKNYLTDRDIFKAERKKHWVDVRPEGEVLALLQAELRRKVARRCVTVEVNPTSNLLIGNLADLTRHPLWRLLPPRDLPDAPPVAICIGSDDPLTFATTLPEEYQYVHDALILAGLGEQKTSRWIERVRENGMEARFTRQRATNQSITALPIPLAKDFSLIPAP